MRVPEEVALAEELEQVPEELDDEHRLIQTQLALIARQLAPLRKVGSRLMNQEQKIETEEPPGTAGSSGTPGAVSRALAA
jgi:prefoldin subunit 5